MLNKQINNPRERFKAVMEYKNTDCIPNYEMGVWGQTIERWQNEGLNIYDLHWNWFDGEEYFGIDAREHIPINTGMLPPFDEEIIEKTDRYEVKRKKNGVITKALIEGTVRGTRASMDQYVSFPVEDIQSFREVKKRYIASYLSRYPCYWKEIFLPRWKNRDHVLVLGRNVDLLGFYWRAREWMGTENLCYAFFDQPDLIHEMMEFTADFTIECTKPFLDEKINPEFVFINEDMAMKNGPLLSPQQYKEFIFPHMKRLVDFLKSNGVQYVVVDSDGNTEPLIPLLMDAGVDMIWPMERAADMDPVALRKKYGKQLRLFGGVDKRELSKDKNAIRVHLDSLRPLVEDGGYIPTVDHWVSPDISLDNFVYYMRLKKELLCGRCVYE